MELFGRTLLLKMLAQDGQDGWKMVANVSHDELDDSKTAQLRQVRQSGDPGMAMARSVERVVGKSRRRAAPAFFFW